MVTSVEDDRWCTVRKLTGTQFRSKKYRVRKCEIIKVPNHNTDTKDLPEDANSEEYSDYPEESTHDNIASSESENGSASEENENTHEEAAAQVPPMTGQLTQAYSKSACLPKGQLCNGIRHRVIGIKHVVHSGNLWV